MTFSINLLIVLSRTISLKVFRKLYNFLLGLGIMIDVETLKCDGQWPKSMYASAMLMNFLRHTAFLIIVKFDIWLTIVLNSFDCQKLTLFDPVHEFSWIAILVSNFLNFLVEKVAFGLFDSALENFPIFDLLWNPILLQISMTILILPYLGVLCDNDNLWVFVPYSVCIISKILYNLLENFSAWNILYVKPFDSFD